MNIKLVSDTIGRADIEDLILWLKQEPIPRLTKGELTLQLEREWANKVGTKYSVYVNSGSSAILLALAAFLQQKPKNKKVIVPSLSWATDISSPMLLGMEPILCDCNLEDLSCDLEQLETLFKKESPAAFILVSPLGLVPDMARIVNLCNKYGVVLFEDVCESMGSKYQGQYLGTFGMASFYSMFFGHHLSTIEGGFINTDDEDFYYLLLMMRSHGWDRDLPSNKQQELRDKYQVSSFDALYTFYVPGFNLRATDLQAFLGLRALEKLDNFTQKRNLNLKLYQKHIKKNDFKLQQRQGDFISNFAYPVLNSDRNNLVEALKVEGVEVRPLIAGNLGNSPMWVNSYPTVKLPNSELIDTYGFYLPNHQNLSEQDIIKISNIINSHK